MAALLEQYIANIAIGRKYVSLAASCDFCDQSFRGISVRC
jgi:hypothetical protein